MMITQIRELLERYAAAGGRVRTEMFDGCGHGPHFDARNRWLDVFTSFLTSP
jgi:pimeloyl-ACP methyl ester carboxylesterase